MNDVRFGSWPARAPVPQKVYEAWSRREDELERVMQTVSAAAVERLEAMSYDEVCRRAAAVEATLAAVAREHGGAATVMGSEEDDWVKLRLEMELDDCRTVAEMPFGQGTRWALRLAAHAASRRDRAPTPGVVPSEAMPCVPTDLVLWNWCQRRLLRRPVQPLFAEPDPTWRQQRAQLRAGAQKVAADAPEWFLANALTRVFNQHVPWYAGVEVLPLQDGHAVITRWGLWYWGIRWSSSSLLDQDAVASVASEVQSLAAGNSRRSWPLRVNQKKMRRAHRGDPHWWGGCPVPNATVTEHEVRIWFGAADAPVFRLPPIGRAKTEAAATRPSG